MMQSTSRTAFNMLHACSERLRLNSESSEPEESFSSGRAADVDSLSDDQLISTESEQLSKQKRKSRRRTYGVGSSLASSPGVDRTRSSSDEDSSPYCRTPNTHGHLYSGRAHQYHEHHSGAGLIDYRRNCQQFSGAKRFQAIQSCNSGDSTSEIENQMPEQVTDRIYLSK